MLTWTEFINHIQATTHKIQKVAVLTEDGQPVAVTEDLQVSPEEGKAIVRCINDPAHSVSKLHIDNNFYTVFQGNNNTVIGTSPNRECIFVGHRQKDAIVLVFGRTKGHGSFLFELKKNLVAKEHSRPQSQISVTGPGQIQQFIHAAEIEADDIEMQDNTEHMEDTFNHSDLADDQVLLQLHD